MEDRKIVNDYSVKILSVVRRIHLNICAQDIIVVSTRGR